MLLRRIYRLRRLQDGFASNVVAAPLGGCPFDQIDPAAEYPAQFVLHPRHVRKRVPCFRIETHQKVDIAVRPEIVPQRGAEQRQLRDLPAFAESGDLVRWKIQAQKSPSAGRGVEDRFYRPEDILYRPAESSLQLQNP